MDDLETAFMPAEPGQKALMREAHSFLAGLMGQEKKEKAVENGFIRAKGASYNFGLVVFRCRKGT